MPLGVTFHRALALPSGKLLVIGGTDNVYANTGYASVVAYDPLAAAWERDGSLVNKRFAFAAAVLKDGRVLVAGGIERSGAATVTADRDVLTASAEVLPTVQ